MAKKTKNIDDHFHAYALQKGFCKKTMETSYFLFLKSSLWSHSVTITQYEFDSIFEKVCIKQEPVQETDFTIVHNWKIINAIKGESK